MFFASARALSLRRVGVGMPPHPVAAAAYETLRALVLGIDLHSIDVGEATQVIATLLAAVAAGAAWASVRQGQRLWRRGVEPDVQVQVLRNVNTRKTDLSIVNVGGGTARGVAFLLVAGGVRTSGSVDDGFVPPGDHVFVETELPWADDSECVVLWRNIDESSWAIDRVGPKERLRRAKSSRRARRRVKGQSLDDVWARFYPDRASPRDLPEGDFRVVRR